MSGTCHFDKFFCDLKNNKHSFSAKNIFQHFYVNIVFRISQESGLFGTNMTHLSGTYPVPSPGYPEQLEVTTVLS